MYEILTLDKEYLSELKTLWNKNFNHEFKTSETIIEDKIFEDSDLLEEASFMLLRDKELMGVIVGKTNNSGLDEFNSCGWINTLLIDKTIRHNGWGEKLLARTEEVFKSRGIEKIILGGDFNNFFSGIPAPNYENTKFFKNRGYTINNEDHFDLMADVSQIDFEEFKIPMNNSEEFQTRSLQAEDIPKLEIFFDEAFPGRWKFEIMKYIAEGGNLREVLALFHKDKIVGFCKVYKSDEEELEPYLYGKHRGSLGPIGIKAEYRGQGVGNRILKDSLNILKSMGAGNVLIDWTILKDFYGQFGFTPFRTYRGAYKI